MKKPFVLICMILFISICYAQVEDVGITFTFANSQITGVSPTYFEFDIMAQATANSQFKVGQVYINYNTDGFGTNIYTLGKVTVTKGELLNSVIHGNFPEDYALGIYSSTVVDNSTSRVAIQNTYSRSGDGSTYASEKGYELSNTLGTTALVYVHVKIEIADPGQTAGLIFENTNPSMAGQQYYFTTPYSDTTTTYTPVIATDTDNTSLSGILSTPANVSINIDGSNVIITWDVVPNATLYKVYSSDDPYSGFNSPDTTGIFIGTTWTAQISGDKKFYYVTAE